MCPTALLEVVVAIHSYGHPWAEETVELFHRKFWCLAYDLPRGSRNLSPDIAKILERCDDCQTTKARRGKQPNTCEVAPVGSIVSPPLQLTSVNCTSVCRSPLEKKWTILWSSSALKPDMYWRSLGKKRYSTVRVLLLCFSIDASICLGCQKS